MIRICLIVALLAGVAVAVLNFVTIREKVTTLVKDRDSERGQKEQAQTELATTKQELETTTAKLKTTEETLAATSAERDAAVARAEKEIKRAGELAQDLQKASVERNDAQAQLFAYKATGFTAEQLVTLAKQMKGLQDSLDVSIEEKKILQRKLLKVENELARYKEVDYTGPALPATLKGKVLVRDPKWDFVVLDVGEDQGLLEWGELLVSRNGKLVAKIQVRTVEKNRSVANVVPGWAIGDVMEGDDVTPAHPAS